LLLIGFTSSMHPSCSNGNQIGLTFMTHDLSTIETKQILASHSLNWPITILQSGIGLNQRHQSESRVYKNAGSLLVTRRLMPSRDQSLIEMSNMTLNFICDGSIQTMGVKPWSNHQIILNAFVIHSHGQTCSKSNPHLYLKV